MAAAPTVTILHPTAIYTSSNPLPVHYPALSDANGTPAKNKKGVQVDHGVVVASGYATFDPTEKDSTNNIVAVVAPYPDGIKEASSTPTARALACYPARDNTPNNSKKFSIHRWMIALRLNFPAAFPGNKEFKYTLTLKGIT